MTVFFAFGAGSDGRERERRLADKGGGVNGVDGGVNGVIFSPGLLSVCFIVAPALLLGAVIWKIIKQKKKKIK